MSLKNIFIIARDFPGAGGRNTFICNLLDNFRERYNFKIISWNQKDKKYLVKKRFFKLPTLSLFFFYLQSFFVLYKLNRKKKIDIIFSTGLSGLGGIFFGRIFKIPVFLSTSGYRGSLVKSKKKDLSDYPYSYASNKGHMLEKLKKYFLVKTYTAFLRVQFDKYSLYLSDKVFLPSNFNIIDLKARGADLMKINYYVIQEGAKPKYSEYSPEFIKAKLNLDNTKKIISFARIDNLQTISDIYKNLCKEYNLIFIMSDRVAFFENKSLTAVNIKIEDVFQITDLLVVPPAQEPHSSTVLEALFLKIPTLVSKVDWLADEFHEFPELFISDLSVRGITERISFAMSNYDLVTKKSRAASKAILGKYNIDKMYKKYNSFFESIK